MQPSRASPLLAAACVAVGMIVLVVLASPATAAPRIDNWLKRLQPSAGLSRWGGGNGGSSSAVVHCATLGEQCFSTSHCCGGAYCWAGMCVKPHISYPRCLPSGRRCLRDNDCCYYKAGSGVCLVEEGSKVGKCA